MTDKPEVDHDRLIGLAYQMLQFFGIYISDCMRELTSSQPHHGTAMTKNSLRDLIAEVMHDREFEAIEEGNK
ncbi:hypothetical protein [Caballeronia sordidicola]|uniref:hypothetical protein n=1 Tax=Caballeronia sordidicola TaxID=196367 RepID=UPI0004D0126C|nr:hypothetical protein [Caballeronia sordidicola]